MILIVLPDIAEEDALLARARQGDVDASRQIFDSYFSPVYQFIRLRVEDVQTAEDLASEVFLKLLNAFRGGTAPRHSLRGWLFRVARNEIYDHFGRQKRLNMTVLDDWIAAPDEDEPEVQFMNTLDVARARRAIKLLTDDQQEVLLLRFGQMLNLQETADIMGKNVNTIKALQFRAVNMLRKVLGDMRTEVSNG
jgi:RNA polymerase sigma-70 factor (ECF subfamily)